MISNSYSILSFNDFDIFPYFLFAPSNVSLRRYDSDVSSLGKSIKWGSTLSNVISKSSIESTITWVFSIA